MALGDNLSLARTVESAGHLDIMLLRPTVVLDDQIVLDAGDPVFAKDT